MISSEREHREKNSGEMKVEEKDRKKWSKMLEQDEGGRESLGEYCGIILMLTGAMCLYVSEKSYRERQRLPSISVLSASECCLGVC